MFAYQHAFIYRLLGQVINVYRSWLQRKIILLPFSTFIYSLFQSIQFMSHI